MFNVEQSIADWRRQMLVGGIKSPVPLDELETHLREDLERRMLSGVDEPQAFEIAVQEIGRPNMLKNEFGKNERKTMRRTMIILLGIFAVLFGPAIFLPALAQHRNQGTWTSAMIIPVVLGVALTLAGVGTAAYGLKTRKA